MRIPLFFASLFICLGANAESSGVCGTHADSADHLTSVVCPLDAGPDTAVCGFTYILMGSERVGSWSVVCSESRDLVTFGDQNTDTTQVSVTRCGSYTFIYTVDTGPCVGTDTVVITFLDPSWLRIYTETFVEVNWETECHQGPSEVICDNIATIEGFDPPELVWDICRTDSCSSRIFDSDAGMILDSCIVDTILFDTTDMTDSGSACGLFSIGSAQDYVDVLGSLGTPLNCDIPRDSCHPCFDTVEVMDTIIVPVLAGGSWHFVDASTGEMIPLMDTSFLQFNGRDYLLIIEPGADYYGPGAIDVILWEIISGVASELTVPVSFELQWVPLIENDTLFQTRDEVVLDTACAAELKLPLPCGGISNFRSGTTSGIPDFPCGPIGISFDVDNGDEFYVIELNCINPFEEIEVCPGELVGFDTPGTYDFECLDGCPSITIVEVNGNFGQPEIDGINTNCAQDQQTYSVEFSVTGGVGPIEVLGAGSFSYGQTITITGITSCEDFIITVLDPLSLCENAVVVSRCCCTISETNISAQICEGDVYDFFGQQLTQTGTYSQTLLTQEGCDSIVLLDLIVQSQATDTRQASICQGESYLFYGQTLTVAGTYEATPIGPDGCDSLVILTLSLDPLQSEVRQIVICDGEAYDFYGDQLTSPGVYEVQFSNAVGCDSLVELVLDVASAVSTEVQAGICPGETYNFNGRILAEEGVYTDTLQTSAGCDSTITLTLFTSDPQFEVLSRPSCFMDATGSIEIAGLSGGLAPYVFSIDGISYQDRPGFSGIPAGDYDVYVVDALGCSAVRPVVVGEVAGIEADIQDAYLICGEDPLVVDAGQTVTAGDSVIYQWSDGSDGTTFTIIANGNYWVEISNSCETRRYDFTVTSEDESPSSRIYVPNVFSPNEDGVNDHFKAFASVPVGNFEMHLYDRWGEELLIMYDIDDFWDGGFLGKKMQPGVYVWWLKAEIENCGGEMSEVMMRGDVTLIR